MPPILKAAARPTASRTGTGELDGKDVVLSDSQELQEDEEMIDGEARTSLAVVEAAGGGGMRLSRQRGVTRLPGPSLPVPRDAEAELDGRASEELAALPISETEERPGRRARSGGGFFKLLLVGALLVGGAWIGGKYYRNWFGGGDGEQAGARSSSPAASEAKPATETDKDRVRAAGSQSAAGAAATAAADAGTKANAAAGQEREAAPVEEAKTERRGAEAAPAREPPARRTRPTAERVVKEKDRVHTIDLKSMMAPDPSQLPPTPPPAPPPPPSEAPAQETP
jgi:hypothetical protein